MEDRVIILTERAEGPLLLAWLQEATGRRHALAPDMPTLTRLLAAPGPPGRVVAFLTDMIVPAATLSALRREPYNIHPGPPEMRGSHVDSFALYERAADFGVTGHVIAPRIDAGEIVHLARFAIPDGAERLAFADLVFSHAVESFAAVALAAAATTGRLARIDARWSGPARTKAGFRALCAPPPGAGAAERVRRARACGPDFSPSPSMAPAQPRPGA